MICSICDLDRPRNKRISEKEETVFVCAGCRCSDCLIVLDMACPSCGETHGPRSQDLPGTCKPCVSIRNRVEALDSELALVRYQSIVGEIGDGFAPLKREH